MFLLQSKFGHKGIFAYCFLDRPNDRLCVRDAVLAATGVKTKGAGGGSRPMQALYARIAHLGFLHDRLKEFIDPNSGIMPQGKYIFCSFDHTSEINVFLNARLNLKLCFL